MKLVKLGLVLAAALLPALGFAQGEQKQVFGDIEVHYMVVNSTTLPAEVAEAYQIKRSGRQGFMMVSVLEYRDGKQMPVPVPALINASYKNLIGQDTEVRLTEIREQDGLYYVATFGFDNEDIYRFRFEVSVNSNQSSPYLVLHQQRMYFE